MKLKDYLKQFEGVDPESDMIFQMYEGCCGDTTELEDPDVEPGEITGSRLWPDQKYVRVLFPPLDIISSCIRAGTARQAVQPLIDRAKAFDEAVKAAKEKKN